MRLAYVDESYTDDFFFLGALVVDNSCVLSLGRALDEVVQQAARDHPEAKIKSDAELHGYALFHSREDWAPLRNKVRARVAVYDQALQAIGAHNARILLCGRDRRLTSESIPIYDVVLARLLQRLNYFATVVAEPVLVIADEVGKHDQHRRSLRDSRGPDFSGHPARQLHNIIDTLHFAPSRHSRFLQAVDLVTFLHCRRIRSTANTDPRATKANDLLWGRVAPIVHESRIDRGTEPWQSTKAPR